MIKLNQVLGKLYVNIFEENSNAIHKICKINSFGEAFGVSYIDAEYLIEKSNFDWYLDREKQYSENINGFVCRLIVNRHLCVGYIVEENEDIQISGSKDTYSKEQIIDVTIYCYKVEKDYKDLVFIIDNDVALFYEIAQPVNSVLQCEELLFEYILLPSLVQVKLYNHDKEFLRLMMGKSYKHNKLILDITNKKEFLYNKYKQIEALI